MKRTWLRPMGACLALAPLLAQAQMQPPDPSDPRACVGIETDSQRLACYDHALGRDQVPGTSAQDQQTAASEVPAQPVEAAPHGLFGADSHAGRQARAGNGAKPPVSLLDSRWELSPDTKLGTYNIRGYKPVYLMPVFYTSRVNNAPTTPAAGHSVDQPFDLDHLEAKFQLSLKTKVWQGIFDGNGDLWVGYTQSSHWQVYNSRISRPFRETNYEPEAMLVFDTHYDVLGWDGKLLGIGINHQSNGRSDPLSRSWNRIIADVGFERGPWTIMIRPWWRIPEQREKDDNPDISDYMGRGEVQIVREWKANEFSLLARHSLRGGDRSHGALKFTWAFPIHNKLRGYMEVFRGYGESMIDYNHDATYLGVGVSLLGWY